MAVFQKIREFLVPPFSDAHKITPAPVTTYTVKPLTDKQLAEVLKLNLRCFKAGENYTKYTFSYLLSDANTLSYRIITPDSQMIGFIFVMVNQNGAGHITTLGIAPEHRRRGLAVRLLAHTERALQNRMISMVTLEVRSSNVAAQNLYRGLGYSIVQRLNEYYNNGEDGLLMVKSI